MPNWCSNTLYIRGKKEDLDAFLCKVEKIRFSNKEETTFEKFYELLQTLYPCPQELQDTVKGWTSDEAVQSEREKQYEANLLKYGHSDWYDWCVDKWGTKWGDCDTDLVKQTDSMLVFGFQSAWSPPVEGFCFISQQFPTLTFDMTYIEESMDFYGHSSFSNDGNAHDIILSVSDIKGFEEIDWDADDAYEIASELVDREMRWLLSRAGLEA